MRCPEWLGVVLAVTVTAPCPAEDLLVEMEQPAARFPDDGSFAEPITEAAASRRRVLLKFYPEGAHAIYRFHLDEPGMYTGWLRYGCEGGEAAQRTRLCINWRPPSPCARAGSKLK